MFLHTRIFQVEEMKRILTGLTVALILTSCSGSGSDSPIEPQRSANSNANNTALHREYGRMEFPRVSQSPTSIVLIHYAGSELNYASEWDTQKKAQRWSCYELYASNLKNAPGVKRYDSDTNLYPKDPLLADSLQWASDPYWNSGFDHGHICPSADRLNSKEANYQTFFMTNMQPMRHIFNSGVWANMEYMVRTVANNRTLCDTLYVCKGGTIDGGVFNDGNKNVSTTWMTTGKKLLVPRYYFMALLKVKNGTYHAIALWIDHEKYANSKETRLAQFAISIDELERRTGIDFFCNLPDEREAIIESKYDAGMWGLN